MIPKAPLQAPPRRGEQFASRYLVGDVLGVGGMGIVYAAVQQALDRRVALKVPRPELVDDDQARDRLRTEALAGAALDHPNLVHVLDFGTERGVPFVVMEHVEGSSLSELLGSLGPLPLTRALPLIRQLVAGLEQAHAHGIVHGDVKCDNVLVDLRRDGRWIPRLIDFGIARFTSDVHSRGPEPVVTGTAEYLPPEVICGEAPTFAADVYAVGVMLYELTTGVTPFAGATSAQVMTSRLEGQALPISLRCPEIEIPEAVEVLVMRALAADPAERFRDAGDLREALEPLVATLERPVAARTRPPQIIAAFASESTTATLRRTAPVRAPALVIEAATDTPDRVIVGCLERARALVDRHCLAAAISVLETGIVQLSRRDEPTESWRLQLALAALYDGVGDRSRAREVVEAARDAALRDGSQLGRERADKLAARLERGPRGGRRSGDQRV